MTQENRNLEKEETAAGKDPATATATDRAKAQVSSRSDRAGDNTPTKPGTEAENAAAGTNETRPDAAKEPEAV